MQDTHSSIQTIINMIREHQSFVIVFHINPDGDAIGATLGLAMLLEKLGKQVRCCTTNLLPPQFLFLPHSASIEKTEYLPQADVIILLECSAFARSGYQETHTHNAHLINIDHHVTNNFYAEANCIQPDLSATSEQIYHLYHAMNEEISRDAAECLYVGILTDTDRFQNSNTHTDVYTIVADLVKRGIDVNTIYKEVYGKRTEPYLRCLGYVLSHFELYYNNTVAIAMISKRIAKKCNIQYHEMEGIIDYVRDIKGVEVAVLLKEVGDGITKASFRSNGALDVDQLAAQYGGGGHKRASGCEMQGSLDDVKALLIADMEKYVDANRKKIEN